MLKMFRYTKCNAKIEKVNKSLDISYAGAGKILAPIGPKKSMDSTKCNEASPPTNDVTHRNSWYSVFVVVDYTRTTYSSDH